MNSGKAKGIITGSLVITFILGIGNSLYKDNKLPSFRFFIGSGMLYLALEFLADFEAEIAQSIAIAIVTLTVLSEGGGLLNHFMGPGVTKNGALNTTPKGPNRSAAPSTAVDIARRDRAVTTTLAANGFAPIKPVIPNANIF